MSERESDGGLRSRADYLRSFRKKSDTGSIGRTADEIRAEIADWAGEIEDFKLLLEGEGVLPEDIEAIMDNLVSIEAIMFAGVDMEVGPDEYWLGIEKVFFSLYKDF